MTCFHVAPTDARTNTQITICARAHTHTHTHTQRQWQTKITVTGSRSHVPVESTNGTVEEAAAQAVGTCSQRTSSKTATARTGYALGGTGLQRSAWIWRLTAFLWVFRFARSTPPPPPPPSSLASHRYKGSPNCWKDFCSITVNSRVGI